MVGQVLAQRQAPVGVEVGQHLDGREELGVLVGALGEVLGVALSPPVLHVSVLVVVASGVVEAVGHLVANHHAYGTIVESVVGSWVEERRLEYACGEANLVGGRVVICVNRLRVHEPLVAVDGLAGLGVNAPLGPEAVALYNVLVVRLRGVDVQVGHVYPLVGIANLYVESVELVERVLLGHVAHPALCLDALAKCHLQVVHERLHAFFRRCGEILVYINLAQGLPHHAFHLAGCALPQREVLLAASQGLSEEVELCRNDVIAQVVGRAHYLAPLHVIAVFVGSERADELVGPGHKLGLAHHEFLYVLGLDAGGVHHLHELDVGVLGVEVGQGHLVIVGLRVAQLGGRLRQACQLGLELHHVLHLLLCLLLGETVETEHAHDVLLVGFAYACRGGVGVEVILFLPECYASLRDVEYVVAGILLVGAYIHAHELAVALGCKLKLYCEKLAYGLGGLHLAYHRHGRLNPKLVAPHRVDGELVEVAQLALGGAGGNEPLLSSLRIVLMRLSLFSANWSKLP